MNSENTPGFAVYNLRDSFSKEPNEINYCPVCEGLLLKFNIPPSKAIVDEVLHHSGFQYDYSHLYECPACNWWAIRESWLDIGANGWYDFLITGEVGCNWRQAMENKDVYFGATAMPHTVRQLFTHKNISDSFVPGDQVRLCTTVVVRQPFGISPPLCVQGNVGVIVRESEYAARYAQQLNDLNVSENILLDDIVKRAMLHESQAALESGIYYAVRLQHIVPLETTEKFRLCNVDEVYLLNVSNLEKV